MNTTPFGVAISPDGLFAYITEHELDQVKEFSLETYAITNTFDVGSDPTGLAILPDGSRLYVSNTADGSVSVIDLASGVVSPPVSVGSMPLGVAISPDGARVYTANYSSSSVSIIDTASHTLVTPSPYVSFPIAVAIMPDGRRGYVSSSSSSLGQLGGLGTLSILKQGDGSGTVTSSDSGIDCGESCRVELTYNSVVTLTAFASDGSTFNGWGGDCSGSGYSQTVTMNSIKNCIANFRSDSVDDSTTPGSDPRSEDCFIATAAYGSYLDPHVETLRAFRDEYLMTNTAGKGFVQWYYDHSPPVANYISQHEGLRLLVRLLLTPFVYGVMYPMIAILLLTGIASLIVWKRRHNKGRNFKLPIH